MKDPSLTDTPTNPALRWVSISVQQTRQANYVYRYLIALASVLAAAVMRVALQDFLDDRNPYTLFLLAIVFSAWVAGPRPAAFALGLGGFLATYFFVEPFNSFKFTDGSDTVALILYFIVGGLIIAITYIQLRTHQRLVTRQELLEREIQQRQRVEDALRQSEQVAQQQLSELEAIYHNAPFGLCVFDADLRYTRLNETLAAMNALPIEAHIGHTIAEILPKLAPLADPLLRRVLETGQPLLNVELQGEVHNQPGIIVSSIAHWIPLQDAAGRVKGINVMVEDVTERKRIETQTELLYEVAAAFTSAATLDEVAHVMNERMFRLLGPGDTASLRLLNEAGDSLDYFATYQPDAQLIQTFAHIPLSTHTPMTQAVRTNSAIWIESGAQFEAQFPEHYARVSPVVPLKASFAIPLRIGKTVIGNIGVGFAEDRAFTLAERGFYLTLAELCAQAIARVRLTEQAKNTAAAAAANEERHRLARDLHDSVNQALFSATTIAEAMPRIWKNNVDKAIEMSQMVVTLNRGAMAEMRTLLLELRPDAILRTALPDLLQYLLDSAQSRTKIEGELRLIDADPAESPVTIPPDVHVNFYRMAQEALHNVVKHSHATHFVLELSHSEDGLVLTIRDNGQGFDTSQIAGGLGLGSLRERAASIGATLEIQSVAGQGTMVGVVWQPSENQTPQST